jgi:hypothetical protein
MAEKKNAPRHLHDDTDASEFYSIRDAAQLREDCDSDDNAIALEHDDEIAEHSFEIAQQIDEINDDWRPCPRSCFRETKLAKWWRSRRKASR